MFTVDNISTYQNALQILRNYNPGFFDDLRKAYKKGGLKNTIDAAITAISNSDVVPINPNDDQQQRQVHPQQQQAQANPQPQNVAPVDAANAYLVHLRAGNRTLENISKTTMANFISILRGILEGAEIPQDVRNGFVDFFDDLKQLVITQKDAIENRVAKINELENTIIQKDQQILELQQQLARRPSEDVITLQHQVGEANRNYERAMQENHDLQKHILNLTQLKGQIHLAVQKVIEGKNSDDDTRSGKYSQALAIVLSIAEANQPPQNPSPGNSNQQSNHQQHQNTQANDSKIQILQRAPQSATVNDGYTEDVSAQASQTKQPAQGANTNNSNQPQNPPSPRQNFNVREECDNKKVAHGTPFFSSTSTVTPTSTTFSKPSQKTSTPGRGKT